MKYEDYLIKGKAIENVNAAMLFKDLQEEEEILLLGEYINFKLWKHNNLDKYNLFLDKFNLNPEDDVEFFITEVYLTDKIKHIIDNNFSAVVDLKEWDLKYSSKIVMFKDVKYKNIISDRKIKARK